MDMDSVSFSIDEDSYCWILNGVLSNKEAWAECEPGKEVTINIGTESYVFIVDSRERTEMFGEKSYTISGRSKTSVYGVGSEPIFKTWGLTTSHDVIRELITDVQIDIQNWTLPAGLLVSEGETAIAIVRRIAEACGGILYTKDDGTLVVCPKYKQDPPMYNINNVDLSLSDFDDITEVTETRELAPGYNQVQVTDEPQSAEGSITIAEISKDVLNKTAQLRVQVYPFASEITLFSSQADVSIPTSVEETQETLNETIEIVNGSGSVSNPIFSMLFSSYKGTNMGLVSFKGSEITTEIKGTTLLEVTYITKYHVMDVTAQTSEKVQVYKED